MIERSGAIRNPLTIIAIFAGIAEVSGTAVLPHISISNQIYFIYFLIGFPILLVILFFVTLNFNNRVLYAPSDFQDESNFVRISEYDQSKQENVQVNLDKSEFLNYFNSLNEQYKSIENRFNKIQNTLTTHPDISKKLKGSNLETVSKNLYEIKINDFSSKSSALVNSLKEKGYSVDLYEGSYGRRKTKDKPSEYESIWLGRNVPADIAIEVIKSAKQMFPFLKYISISGDHGEGPPENVHNEMFMGGATASAIGDNIKELKDSDFEKLYEISSRSDLHKFIRSFY